MFVHRAELSKFGNVVSCDTGTVRSGRTRGWAIVEMGSESDANACINEANGLELDGRPLIIRFDAKPDKPQVSRAPRAAPGGGGGGGKGGGGKGGGDPSLEGKPENSTGLQIVVRNLPWSVTSEMLRGTFEQIGPVLHAEVICHADSGRSKGWGTVCFNSEGDAADAIARFGGVELAGRPMTVMVDRFN